MNVGRWQLETLARATALLAWIVVLAILFAQAEIQIEGARGWAAGLPTWRIVDHPVLSALFGGREVTGYHVFVFSFMAAVFHLPLFLTLRWSWRLEARVLGCLALFWIIEDALWFALNPAYGLARLSPAQAPWHPHWLLGVPVDYLVGVTVGCGLLGWSFAARPALARQEPP
ncbi:MAG: hypothetical protein WCR06_11795 [bacterium]